MAAEMYELDVVLAESCEAESFGFVADDLRRRGITDALIAMPEDWVRLSFSRAADSLSGAVKSVLADIRASGYTPRRVEIAAQVVWSPEMAEAQENLRKLYETAKAAGQRYWDANMDDLNSHYGVPPEGYSLEYTAAEQDYEAAQSQFKQAMHALLGLSEEEVNCVYNPNF